jgi:hypothetical protein
MPKKQINADNSNIEPPANVTDKTEDIEDTGNQAPAIPLEKPKRILTDKQKENLEKGRIARQERIKQKQSEKQEEAERLELLEQAKRNKKEKEIKKQEKIIEKYLSNDDDDTVNNKSDDDTDEEIVIVKRKPKAIKKQKPVLEPPKKFTTLKHKDTHKIQQKPEKLERSETKDLDYSQYFV